MRDNSDMKDIAMFLRCREGKAYLGKTASMVKGRTITDVTFVNQGHCLATTLALDGGDCFVVYLFSLEAYALREEFDETIEGEYYKDLCRRGQERKRP